MRRAQRAVKRVCPAPVGGERRGARCGTEDATEGGERVATTSTAARGEREVLEAARAGEHPAVSTFIWTVRDVRRCGVATTKRTRQVTLRQADDERRQRRRQPPTTSWVGAASEQQCS